MKDASQILDDLPDGSEFAKGAGQDVPSIDWLDDVLLQMDLILNDIPTCGDFAESGRYTWPERWAELKTWIEEMKSSNV